MGLVEEHNASIISISVENDRNSAHDAVDNGNRHLTSTFSDPYEGPLQEVKPMESPKIFTQTLTQLSPKRSSFLHDSAIHLEEQSVPRRASLVHPRKPKVFSKVLKDKARHYSRNAYAPVLTNKYSATGDSNPESELDKSLQKGLKEMQFLNHDLD